MRSWPLPLLSCALAFAQAPDNAFFESKIRPVLATKCYSCHSTKLKAPMGDLVLDTRAGVLKGGRLGPAVVPGKPAEGNLLKALSFTNAHLQMPPTGKLPDAVIADFARWIAAGAPDPRNEAPQSAAAAALRGMSIEEGRKWWAFQPVAGKPLPAVKDVRWAKGRIDHFILAKLEEKGLKPSPAANAATLVRRAYVDLVGYKPTFGEVQAFVQDKTPDAYEKLIDRLMASPQYGERWGRHWMDVARFAEDNPTSEATNPPYPFAWRYRDWIIEAINKDVPYDKFVKLQLAADLTPGTSREDLRALGYLGAAPIYHKDQRLSAEVIGGFMTDDWDERIDAVTRGLLGLTVACARCHDHKFDPVPTKDYYGLMGVFASTMRAERPMFEVDPAIETRYLWIQNRLFDLKYSANLLTNEASTVENAAPRVGKWKAEIESLRDEMKQLEDRYPKLVSSLEKYWTFPPPRDQRPAAAPVKEPPPAARPRRGNPTSTEPFMNAVYEAAQYVDGSDANYTFINYKPGEIRDFPVLLHGNVATPGEMVPRHFPEVLSKGNSRFTHGSGRLELAERIFTDAAPLAARVIVNRVWDWHMGKPLVPTPSDFGTQGEKPTHPELLDDLAARFIAHGWSLKWLNREIMTTATYRQASQPRADAAQADPANALLWRINPRRMDVESYRDTLLRVTSRLSDQMYGPSEDVDSETSVRRTVYSRVSRGRVSKLFRLYDFPDASQTAPNRDLTTSALQQLFIMNGGFMRLGAQSLAKAVEEQPDHAAKVQELFRRALGREPAAKELDLALTFLDGGTIEQYAHVLLSSNELIFWP